MRSKENANDYRYFPDPDLQPVIVTKEYVARVKETLSPLPNELFEKFTNTFGLSEYDTNVLIEDKEIVLLISYSYTKNYKSSS